MDKALLTAILLCDGKKCVNNYDKIFMYVKNWCPHSIKAAALALEVCNCVSVLDVESGSYVQPNDLKQPFIVKPDTQYIQAFISLVNKTRVSSVPRIFGHNNGKWEYIGGETDFTVMCNSSYVENMFAKFQEVKF